MTTPAILATMSRLLNALRIKCEACGKYNSVVSCGTAETPRLMLITTDKMELNVCMSNSANGALDIGISGGNDCPAAVKDSHSVAIERMLRQAFVELFGTPESA